MIGKSVDNLFNDNVKLFQNINICYSFFFIIRQHSLKNICKRFIKHTVSSTRLLKVFINYV